MSDASPYVLPIIVILVIWGVMQLLQRTKKQAQSAPSGQDQPAQKTLVECPACKTSVSAEAAKCPKCGHPFPMRPQNKQLIIGLCFVAFGLWVKYKDPGNLPWAPQDSLARNTWWIMILCGAGMIYYSRHGKSGNRQ
jgi:hypothetical protein